MNIVVFSAFYLPMKGGYIESLHEFLKRLRDNGHRITIFTCRTSQKKVRYEDIQGLHVIQLPAWNPKSLNQTYPIPKPWVFVAVLRFFWKNKVDLISTQTRFFPTSWLGFAVAKVYRIPLYHTERGGSHTESDSRIVRWIGIILDHSFGFLLSRYATVAIGVSDATCRFLKHLGAKSPVTIYNGIDVNYWTQGETFKKEGKMITFVGRLVYAKGVHDLLNAFKLSGVDATVYIIGDGEYRPALEKLAKNLGIDKRVIFVGQKDREFIRRVLHATDVFVNPSYSEGLPRTVLEAGAAGCAVIATDVGGTNEIIPSSRYGIRVKAHDIEGTGNALVKLLNDPSLRTTLSQNLQGHIREKFTWESVINNYEELFIGNGGKVVNVVNKKNT